ncbi:MAG: hypothetical protein HOD64_06880, partial [Candidatus Cloacimonetes bacterium]|nr:hypothetical protein [Candidatus Cloacimonadota bacterium]
TWPPFKRADSGMQIKSNKKLEEPAEKASSKIVPEIEKEDKMVKLEQLANPEATVVNDSVDYLDELLFKDKESPFNYNE